MCEECGLYRNQDNSFTLVFPSDCHNQGGHYQSQFNDKGEFLWTNASWQTFPNENDLDMSEIPDGQGKLW